MTNDRRKLDGHGSRCLGMAVFVLLLVAAPPRVVGQSAAMQPTKQRQGQLVHLLRHDCGSCHGITLNGGLGRPLSADVLGDWRDEDIAQIILNGVAGTPMPPWASLLSKSDALWLARYLKAGGRR